VSPAVPQVSCSEPYEWKDATADEWEFSQDATDAAAGKKFKVRWGVGGKGGWVGGVLSWVLLCGVSAVVALLQCKC
jgi:hypothetical protein